MSKINTYREYGREKRTRESDNGIRAATAMERNRAKAVAFGSFVVVVLLTAAIIVASVTLYQPKKNGKDPVSTAIVFAVPVQEYAGVLKDCSMTELQWNNTMERWEAHKCIDIEAPKGTPVLATFAGTVTSIVDHTLNGRQITIEHRDGLKTVYGNLDQNVNVSQGDRVEKGQRIGSVGQTSNIEFTNIPHLRVEVLKDGKRVNPNDYIDLSSK
jgi:murein DD-endopeptidase MepM/ murein hydrolase activator NlpD